MFTLIEDLPDHVIGIEISEKLRADDYTDQLIPLVNERLAKHDKLDLLCRFTGEWQGMEAGAAWEDMRLGLGKLGHWARMAIVCDIKWMENSIKLLRVFSPGELRHFKSADFDQAREWVCASDRARIACALDAETGILTLEPAPDTALSEDDFQLVGRTIKAYLDEHDSLPGILISTRRFPGWQSVGALFAHLKFVSKVHDKIKRVALVTNSPMGSFADRVLDPLMLASIRKFDFDQRDEAVAWLQD